MNGEGPKPGCWCSGSWARTGVWRISSFRVESFSNPSVSSSVLHSTLCWAYCLSGQFLQKIDFPSSIGGQERGSRLSLIFRLSLRLCSEILTPWSLRPSWAMWLLVDFLSWALGFPSVVSILLSPLSLVHSLSIFQKTVGVSPLLLSPFQFSLTLWLIACKFFYCDKCIL